MKSKSVAPNDRKLFNYQTKKMLTR